MKKLFLVVFLGLFLVPTLFTGIIRAADLVTPLPEDRIDNSKVYEDAGVISDTINENTTNANNVEKSAAKSILGHSMSFFQGACPTCFKNSEELPDELKTGLVEMVDKGVVSMFDNQPRVNVVAHLAEEWVPGYKETNSVYASGYDDLKTAGVTELWSKTRNIAYAGYVIIMIVIGFMIMFRNKIGGQVMVTLGNSLPKIVFSLVLVTFSFFLIGFIIDIGGILRNVISEIYYPGSPDSAITIHNPLILFSDFVTKKSVVATGVTGALGLAGIIAMIVTAFSPVGLLLALLGLLLSGFVIVGAVKLWFTLLKAYFGLLANVVLAPFTIMLGALPGNDSSMMNTFKSAARNVLVFPIAFAIVNLPYFIDGEGVSLAFPESLVGASTLSGDFIPGIIINVAKIAAIYAAASAPSIAKSIIPATASKSGMDTSQAIKDSISKTPLIGGLFK